MKAKSKFGFQFRIYLQDTEGCPKFLEQYLDDKYESFEHKEVLKEMKEIVDNYVDERLGIKI